MKNYEYKTIKDGRLIVYNELEDHRRNKFVESWFSENQDYFKARLEKFLEINPHSIFSGLVKN